MIRRVKHYEITTQNSQVINITKKSTTGIVSACAYKYNDKLNCWIKLEDINFNTLKNGIYKNTIDIF